MSKKLVMMSGFALQGALEPVVLPAFVEQSGVRVETRWSPTTLVMKALAEGQEADVVVLADDAISNLVEQGMVEAADRAELALAQVGVGVLKGNKHPDISTAASFRQALLAAQSVAYSKAGASGIYFEKLIERLQIADEIRKKAVVIPEGLTGERVVAGEADLAIQQISELMMVEGVDIVGPLPREIECVTGFTAAVLKNSKQSELAAKLLRALASPESMRAYEAAGLAPRG